RRLDELRRAEKRHRGVVTAEARAVRLADVAERRAVGGHIGDEDLERHDVLRSSARRLEHADDVVERAAELLGERVAAPDLAGEVDEPPACRDDGVRVACRRVDDAVAHSCEPDVAVGPCPAASERSRNRTGSCWIRSIPIATIRIAPVTICCQKLETPAIDNPFCSVPMKSTPTAVPVTPPTPPRKLVPPRSTAAAASSGVDSPTS